MLASKITVTVLMLGLFLGGYRVENAALCYLHNDTRLLYLTAQLKMAMGDRDGGLELMRRVGEVEHQNAKYEAAGAHCTGQRS